MRPSILPKQRYLSLLKDMSYGSTMKIEMAMQYQLLCVSQNSEIFYDRLRPGLRDDDSY